ncbi:MAG: hypothetical protein SFU98_10545 [Leptospiraceae bacterium]|nr:hypothetical protein [Leptospiraceae bacterium]
MKFLLVCTLAFSNIFSESFPTAPNGIGAILPDNLSNGTYLFPNKDLTLYEKTKSDFKDSGVVIGLAKKDTVSIKKGELILITKLVKPIKILETDLVEMRYEGKHIQIFSEEKEFLGIFLRGKNNSSYYIKKNDLAGTGYSAKLWIEVMKDFPSTYIISNKTITVFEKPNSKSKKILSVNDTSISFDTMFEIKDNWLKVKVSKHNGKLCETNHDKILETKDENGWIQVIDSKGAPRVWFFKKDSMSCI